MRDVSLDILQKNDLVLGAYLIADQYMIFSQRYTDIGDRARITNPLGL